MVFRLKRTAASSVCVRTVLGINGSCYLYRTSESTRPTGIAVVTRRELPHGQEVDLEIEFPWNTVLKMRAFVHWVTPLSGGLIVTGLKLRNPAREVKEAINRAALAMPTFLFDSILWS